MLAEMLFFAWVSFDRQGVQLVHANYPSAGGAAADKPLLWPPFFHELRVMFLRFVEPTLLAFPFEAFRFDPFPNGCIGQMHALPFLESRLQSF